MGGRLLVRAALATLMLAAACGGDDDVATGATDPTASSSSSSTTLEAGSWCDELSALVHSGDASEELIAGAPDDLATPLEVLAGAADVDPDTSEPGTLARLFRAYATVESWGHERCGGDHPFCSLWTTLAGTIAAAALSGADEEDAAADLRTFLDEIDDVLIENVPPEMRPHLDTFMASIRSSTMSDADERAAEAADDALDQWAWSERCEGASEPEPVD